MGGPIDLMTVAIIFGAALLAIGLTAWMLNRAWGDFPSRAGPDATSPLMPLSPEPRDAFAQPPADELAPDGDEDVEPAQLPAGAPAEGLIPVSHPLVLRAIQQSLERPGSPYATYFIRHDEQVYLALYRIADPGQRELARKIFEGLQSGELGDVGPADLMRLLSQLGKQ
jgi:hypothetical protein